MKDIYMNELNDYINYLSLERQLSTNTIDGYKRDLVYL